MKPISKLPGLPGRPRRGRRRLGSRTAWYPMADKAKIELGSAGPQEREAGAGHCHEPDAGG